jgi:fructokinase
MHSLLSYGEVLVDFLPSSINNPSYTPLAGGAPANVAVAYAKLGGTGYFAGGISEDSFGKMLHKQLIDEGVDTRYIRKVEDANTAIVLVTLDSSGERSFNFYRNNTADTQYQKEQVDGIDWSTIGIFHFCSNTLTNDSMYENTLYALNQARDEEVVISFDVNLRQQLWSDLSLLSERVEECIKLSTIIKLSRDEAEYLAEIKHIHVNDYINYLLLLGAKLVVITDGANAVQMTSINFSTKIQVPKLSPIDTTGAGDSFISGFLFYLAQTVEETDELTSIIDVIDEQDYVYKAVVFGSNCGAFTCQKKGAFAALPTMADLNHT